MIGVYKITNKINGKMYIGASINLPARKTDHFKPYRINKFKHLPIYAAMLEFGRENFEFEVIEKTTKSKLDEREEYYITKFNTVEDGYNIVSTSHVMNDEEYVKKVHGAFFSNWNKEQWRNNEYRKERSEHSSQVQKERLKDPKYLAEKSKQLKQYTDSIKKPVGQYDKQGNLIAVFDGVREAERAMDLPNDTIGKVCRGVKYRKTAKGFVWKYL